MKSRQLGLFDEDMPKKKQRKKKKTYEEIERLYWCALDEMSDYTLTKARRLKATRDVRNYGKQLASMSKRSKK